MAQLPIFAADILHARPEGLGLLRAAPAVGALITAVALRGRVGAVEFVFIGASNELGELESGLTASWCGAVPAVAFGGVASVVVVLLFLGLFPALRRLDRIEVLAEEG